MFRQHLHLHHRPLTGVSAFPRGARFFADDGGDGGPAGGSGGGSVKMAPAMTQESFDAIVRDAKEQAKRSATKAITDKYGDLDDLKAKADAAGSDAEGQKAVEALLKSLVPDATDGMAVKDLLAKAGDRVKTLTDLEAEKANADLLTVRQDALKAAGIKPELAGVLKLEGTTAEELAKEIEDKALKTVVGATGATPPTPPAPAPKGQGTNPAGTGAPQAATLAEAIADHYEGQK